MSPSNFGKKTIDALSFTSEIRELCEVLNRKLEQSDEGQSKTVVSHPGGFSKELSRRRLSIAESYKYSVVIGICCDYVQPAIRVQIRHRY